MERKVVSALVLLSGMFSWTVNAEEIGDTLSADRSGTGNTVSLEKMVITATRLETPLREIASSMTVIDGDELARAPGGLLLDVLRTVPGIDVVQNGGVGMMSNVYLRGSNPEHTLVLLDGVELNDPVSMGRSYNFADLTTDNIERIEIIRGPQSTLYGSDALGGVINILTKRGTGKPSFYAAGEGGARMTFRESAGMSGRYDWLDYSFGISRLDTKGLSAAGGSYGNKENDGYRNVTFSNRFGARPSERLGLEVIARYIASESEIDYGGGVGGDDPNNVVDLKQLALGVNADLSAFRGLWEQKYGVAYATLDRGNVDGKDALRPADSTFSTFKGNTIKFEWQNNLFIHKNNTLTGGLEYEQEQGKAYSYFESAWFSGPSVFDLVSSSIVAGYLQDQIKLFDCFFTTAGFRIDYHKEFRKQLTGRIASACIIKPIGMKIKGTLGTGFKAPSLYQRYSEYGDQKLEPERSLGIDGGVEQSFAQNKIQCGVTGFYNYYDHLIQFNLSTWLYNNIAEAETKGVEIFAHASLVKELMVRLQYTYMITEDLRSLERLLQRPENKLNGSMSYRLLDRIDLSFDASYIGTRDGYDEMTRSRVAMDDYVLVNTAVSCDILKNLRLFFRIDNIFNEEYEEVKGYSTPGISAFGGFKVSL